MDLTLEERAAIHAALGDPTRLAIVDALWMCDRAPSELGEMLDVSSNLLSHHLDTLEAAGLTRRVVSHGDRRRRYVRLDLALLNALHPVQRGKAREALFVCTHNSARSQLAAALWQQITSTRASSAGTHPAPTVHPGAVAAGRRARLAPIDGKPRALDSVRRLPPIVVTVCDQAHEELAPAGDWLHWSIADPAEDPRAEVFDATVAELRQRIGAFAPTLPGQVS